MFFKNTRLQDFTMKQLSLPMPYIGQNSTCAPEEVILNISKKSESVIVNIQFRLTGLQRSVYAPLTMQFF